MTDFLGQAMQHLHNGAPAPDLDAMSPLDLLKVYGHSCNAWGHFSAQLAAIRLSCGAKQHVGCRRRLHDCQGRAPG